MPTTNIAARLKILAIKEKTGPHGVAQSSRSIRLLIRIRPDSFGHSDY